nr:MAG TPA: hypothetical protein [Caudoviricetes sp.]
MTDEQIIKALECCVTDDGDDCFQCPYGDIVYKPGNGGCVNRCHKDALDLINRQKAEIERLQTRNDELNILNKTAAQEAIKEFVEQLKQNINESIGLYWDEIAGGYYVLEDVINDIDNLVKEITEVQE